MALVVDPVLGSSSGAAFADEATLQAYREELLPRADVVTPNRREARALLGADGPEAMAQLPALAKRLRARGAGAVCITGGDDTDHGGQVLDWLDSDACLRLARRRAHRHRAPPRHRLHLRHQRGRSVALGFVAGGRCGAGEDGHRTCAACTPIRRAPGPGL